MWPNRTLSLFAGGMHTSRIDPLFAERTELHYDCWFEDTTEAARPARERTVAANLDVVRHDFEVCEHAHRDYATGAYRAGPGSPRHEQGVACLQRRLIEASAAQAAVKTAAWGVRKGRQYPAAGEPYWMPRPTERGCPESCGMFSSVPRCVCRAHVRPRGIGRPTVKS